MGKQDHLTWTSDPTRYTSSSVTSKYRPDSSGQGTEEYEFYEREGFERLSGDMVFPSDKVVVSHDLDLLKWRPREDTQRMSVKDVHENGS
jgi:hypothetical protein